MKNITPQIRDIYCQAMDCGSEADLAAFIDSACGDDAALRRQVKKLLEVRSDVGDFLGGTIESEPEEVNYVGTQIGPYKLLQVIGANNGRIENDLDKKVFVFGGDNQRVCVDIGSACATASLPNGANSRPH